jgi:hypothetical protein
MRSPFRWARAGSGIRYGGDLSRSRGRPRRPSVPSEAIRGTSPGGGTSENRTLCRPSGFWIRARPVGRLPRPTPAARAPRLALPGPGPGVKGAGPGPGCDRLAARSPRTGKRLRIAASAVHRAVHRVGRGTDPIDELVAFERSRTVAEIPPAVRHRTVAQAVEDQPADPAVARLRHRTGERTPLRRVRLERIECARGRGKRRGNRDPRGQQTDPSHDVTTSQARLRGASLSRQRAFRTPSEHTHSGVVAARGRDWARPAFGCRVSQRQPVQRVTSRHVAVRVTTSATA